MCNLNETNVTKERGRQVTTILKEDLFTFTIKLVII